RSSAGCSPGPETRRSPRPRGPGAQTPDRFGGGRRSADSAGASYQAEVAPVAAGGGDPREPRPAGDAQPGADLGLGGPLLVPAGDAQPGADLGGGGDLGHQEVGSP